MVCANFTSNCLLSQVAAFQQNTWRGVALKEDLVAAIGMVFALEEVTLADFGVRGRRREGRDMPAHAIGGFARAHHHRHRVPSGQIANRALQLPLPG